MKRRSRTRRILKWVGLVGCVATVLVLVSSLFWSPWLWWLTNGGAEEHLLDVWPGGLHYLGVYYDQAGSARVHSRLGVGPQDSLPALQSWFQWPRLDTLRFVPDRAPGPAPIAKAVTVFMPLWPVFGVLAIPTAILWYRDRRPPKGHCQTCGYDLTGNVSGVCPECGKTIAKRS